jgi:phosphatidate cytidylyltransferase
MDPAKTSDATLGSWRSNLVLRVASAAVLAPAAVAAAYFGGPTFVVFWAVAAICVLWEWDNLVCAHDKNPVLTIGSVAIGGGALLLLLGRTGTAMALIVLGMLGATTLASKAHRIWCVGGVFYAGALMVGPVLLRSDAALGFVAIVFLFTVVWFTDILAYFCGRAFGGPKLMPTVSPKKTWSGAIGGTVAGIAGGVAVAWYAGIANIAAVAVLALILSMVSQAGDLFESAVKRRFDPKDASGLIPGHGGVMDRVDGFVVATLVAASVGVARGGMNNPAQGLLVW